MKSCKNIYPRIYNKKNLVLAWKKARKGKTKKDYVIEFELDLGRNLLKLHEELKNETYSPLPLETFILRDPKTRIISKADFRDRIVHHALCNAIEPIFDKTFIYDSCANRKGKGTSFAIKRFDKFKRKVTKNLTSKAYCLKADIKHYFKEINHKILLKIIKRKITCKKTIKLIKKIILTKEKRGLPLGNLTSQFFANVYLNELDYFVKHKLKSKHYLRYVDDFMILSKSKIQLIAWKKEVIIFLKQELILELHPDKSKIVNLSKGIDFVGFRNFYHYKLLRKRNKRNIQGKIELFEGGEISQEKFMKILQGWNAYANQANSYNLRKSFLQLHLNLFK
jgi:RNA-directed DNA polymerase